MAVLRITAKDAQYDVDLTAEQWKTFREARNQGRLHILTEKGHYVLAEELTVDPTPKPDEWTVQQSGHVFAMGTLVPAHGKVNTRTATRLSETDDVETVET